MKKEAPSSVPIEAPCQLGLAGMLALSPARSILVVTWGPRAGALAKGCCPGMGRGASSPTYSGQVDSWSVSWMRQDIHFYLF